MHENFAEAHLAVCLLGIRRSDSANMTSQYGNEPDLGYSFSAAAILITIPSSSERKLSLADAMK